MSRSLSLLIVEDRFEHVTGTVKKLRRFGHRVTFAQNWEIACKQIRSERYDLLIVDWRWPVEIHSDSDETVLENGGQELVAQLRSGRLGSLNKDATVWLFTVYDTEVLELGLDKIGTDVHVFSKMICDELENRLTGEKLETFGIVP